MGAAEQSTAGEGRSCGKSLPPGPPLSQPGAAQQGADNLALPTRLRRCLLVGVLVALALVIAGHLLVPATSLLSTIAASAILLAYAGMAALGPVGLHRRHPDILSLAMIFGLLAGAVFAGEIILEYVLLPTDNSRYGKAEFGTVFALYCASALVAALRSRSIKNAVYTSVASAFIASLVWVITVLSVFYVFRGSARQILVLHAEGDYEDFARSGMSDFNAFIMEDFMGATFFHLSLGLLAAAVLGVIGGLVGKAIAQFRK